MQQRWFVAIVFVIGCATGSVASRLGVAPVQARTNPARWEYYCGNMPFGTLTAQLNKLGAEGWELVSEVASRSTRDTDESFAAAFTFCAKRALL